MTDETPVTPSRWTPEVVIGLLCLVASAVLPHLGLEAAASGFAAMAFWLLSPIRSPLTPGSPPTPRGYARADVLAVGLAVGLALLAVALLAGAGGCLAREVRAERSVDFAVSRGPPCVVTVRADGDLVHTTRGETVRCAVEIDGEVRP